MSRNTKPEQAVEALTWTEEDEKSFRQRGHDLWEKGFDHAPTEAEKVERIGLLADAMRRKLVLKRNAEAKKRAM